MIGSMLGVLLEGTFCLLRKGHWESHVVSVWGPFCIIYGFGASFLYAGSVLMERKKPIFKFVVFSVIATVIEYIGGAMLKYGLNMKAWDYSKSFMNYDGIICIGASVIWGFLGLAFSKYALPPLEKMFEKMNNKHWDRICICLSVFMAVNLSLTAFAITRWAHRHNSRPQDIQTTSVYKAGAFLDKAFPDEYMEHRFIEWSFLDK